MNVRVLGNGPRVVVLTQTMGMDQSTWRFVVPNMARYRFILYDMVCSGRVNRAHYNSNRYTTINSYVDDLILILNNLGIRRCAFVGHSMSCMIGLLAAVRHPQLIRKLVLFNASPRFMNDLATNYYGGFHHDHVREMFHALERNYNDHARGLVPLVVADDLLVPDTVKEFSRSLFNMHPEISHHVFQCVINTDLRGMLASVATPCVLVQTTSPVPTADTNYLRDNLGGHVVILFLPNQGLTPQLRAPGPVTELLKNVLRNVY
ncbi:unnamed protein product [Urochloa humidicola]